MKTEPRVGDCKNAQEFGKAQQEEKGRGTGVQKYRGYGMSAIHPVGI